MIQRNYYYCLLAGLPDIVHDDKKLHFSSVKFREYLEGELHPSDFELVRLFYLPFDHLNLLNLLFNKGKEWDERGNYPEEKLGQILSPKLFEEVSREQFPGYLYRFGQLLREKEELEEEFSFNEACQFLTGAYYQTLAEVPNKFVRELARFRVDTGNILLALNGRKHELPFEDALVGSNMVTEAIRKNKTRDFGLAVDLPEIEHLIQLFETENILERELKLDLRHWNFLDEITVFNYFTIEKVLAFLMKIFIAERWFHLDYEKGQVMFNKLLQEIESSFEFPEEFSHMYGKKN